MITHIENPIEYTKRPLKLICEFNRDSEYKIKINSILIISDWKLIFKNQYHLK